MTKSLKCKFIPGDKVMLHRTPDCYDYGHTFNDGALVVSEVIFLRSNGIMEHYYKVNLTHYKDKDGQWHKCNFCTETEITAEKFLKKIPQKLLVQLASLEL